MSLKTIGPLTREQRESLLDTAQKRLASVRNSFPEPSDEQEAIIQDLIETICEHENALNGSNAEDEEKTAEEKKNSIAAQPTAPELTNPDSIPPPSPNQTSE